MLMMNDGGRRDATRCGWAVQDALAENDFQQGVSVTAIGAYIVSRDRRVLLYSIARKELDNGDAGIVD